MKERCYLRGLTLLGLVNTLLGCLAGRVIVRVTDAQSGRTLRWALGRAANYPPEGSR